MEKRTVEEIEKEILQTKKELENVRGTETEVYARIVGYYRAVKNWNKGKRDEFNNRKLFSLDGESYTEAEKDSAAHQTETASMSVHEEKKNFGGKEYYELFTRKTCPNCPPVKEFMENINIEGKSVDVDTAEGLSDAASKGVFASPTVIVYDGTGKETARAHSVEELNEIFDNVLVKEAY